MCGTSATLSSTLLKKHQRPEQARSGILIIQFGLIVSWWYGSCSHRDCCADCEAGYHRARAQRSPRDADNVRHLDQRKDVDLLKAGLAETKQCKNEQQLQARKWKDYKGTRFYDGERALVIKRWLTVWMRMRQVSHLRSGTHQRM